MEVEVKLSSHRCELKTLQRSHKLFRKVFWQQRTAKPRRIVKCNPQSISDGRFGGFYHYEVSVSENRLSDIGARQGQYQKAISNLPGWTTTRRATTFTNRYQKYQHLSRRKPWKHILWKHRVVRNKKGGQNNVEVKAVNVPDLANTINRHHDNKMVK